MNIWFKRLHVILTVGGGFLGVALTLQMLFSVKDLTVILFAMFAIFTGFYIYGIFAGLRLAEKEEKTHLIVFYLLQIPWISSPIFGYRFTSGFHISGAILDSRLSGFFRLGSDWQCNLFQKIPWGIGLNVFALAMVIILLNQKNSNQSADTIPTSTPR